jgi:18S rRNA (guanine1575-N7)-methyltransferase
LQAGYTKETLAEAMSAIPQGADGEELEDEEEEQVSYFKKRAEMKRNKSKEPAYKSKNWIKEKKDRQSRQGRETREDSKYSGRKRKGRGVY